jgi:hypothetical protein
MKDTYYFSHDYNARNDHKIKKLISKHGYLGYGLFWAIIEDLYNNANALQTDYESIAFDLRTSESIIESIINDFDLFIIDGDFFGSLSVERRLNERSIKSQKASKSALSRWNKSKENANALQTQSDSNAIKERKVNENKENKIENTCLTFDEFWNMYGKKVDSKKCKDKFETIKESDRKKILATLELYVKSKPEVKFRKDPIRYLTGEIWNDEIIESKPIFADPKIESFYNSSLAMIRRGERTHKEHNEVVKQNKYDSKYLLQE